MCIVSNSYIYSCFRNNSFFYFFNFFIICYR